MPASFSRSRLWLYGLGFAGINECAMALYHFVLPFQMGWERGLGGVPSSIVWALYALNFSWSLIVLILGVLVLSVAKAGPDAGVFGRRIVLAAGLCWLIHGAYTWIRPLPMPASWIALRAALAAFPLIMVAFHWAPLFATRASSASAVQPAR